MSWIFVSRQLVLMSKLFKVIAAVSVLFVLWIIFSADLGLKNIFFDLTNAVPYGDKLGHFFLFGILTLTVNIALKYKRTKFWKKLPLGTLLVSIFVVIEELSQAFFPNRTLDITDLIADALGILVFTYISYLLFKNDVLGLTEANKNE